MSVFSGVRATQTLTSSAAPADTNTVTIGGKVYTFQTTLTNVDGNVLIGVSEATSLQNLRDAVNLTGTPGTQYAAAMTKNKQVHCPTAIGAHTLVFEALMPGTVGNLIVSTETHANASFGAGTLASGTGSAHADLLTWLADLQASEQLNANVLRRLQDFVVELGA